MCTTVVRYYPILTLQMTYLLEAEAGMKTGQLKLSPRTTVIAFTDCPSSQWSIMITENNPNTPEAEQSVKFPSESQD